MKHLLLLDNSLPMVTPLQALDFKEVNKHTVPAYYVLVRRFILRNAIHTLSSWLERSFSHTTFQTVHRKLVKNVDFSKQMFSGINKKEQDRVRARFSMDVTKRFPL
jgi:hypothetical protein